MLATLSNDWVHLNDIDTRISVWSFLFFVLIFFFLSSDPIHTTPPTPHTKYDLIVVSTISSPTQYLTLSPLFKELLKERKRKKENLDEKTMSSKRTKLSNYAPFSILPLDIIKEIISFQPYLITVQYNRPQRKDIQRLLDFFSNTQE